MRYLVAGVAVALISCSSTESGSRDEVEQAGASAGGEARGSATRPVIAQWLISRDTSLMDGTPEVAAMLFSSNDVEASLVLRCQDNETALMLLTQNAVDGDYDDNVSIRVRLDARPAEQQVWKEATSGRGMFARSAIATIRQFASAQRVLIEYPTLTYGRQIAEFNMAGVQPAIESVSTGCAWEAAEAAAAAAKARDAAAASARQRRQAEIAEAQKWVASRGGAREYYRNTQLCGTRQYLMDPVYFATEAEAQAAGYRRSAARGC